MDRLRQAIAARIPPLTDDDMAALEREKWDQLQVCWEEYAKRKTEHAAHWERQAKVDRREATEAEAAALQAKKLRGNQEAFDNLSGFLGITLACAAMGKVIDWDAIDAQRKSK